jgi:hypothetical protein
MKFKLLSILILFASQISFGQYSKWHRDTVFQGIEFKKVRFRTDGKESLYADGILKQNSNIQGYPCYRNIILDKEGNPKQFILHEKASIAGHEFEKGTRVVIQNDGDFSIWCLYEAEIQGYRCKGTSHRRELFLGLPGSTKFVLYPSGKLKSFNPVEDIQIQGVWCKSSWMNGQVDLYESGALQECISAREQTIQGKVVGKNTSLRFEEDGRLAYALE